MHTTREGSKESGADGFCALATPLQNAQAAKTLDSGPTAEEYLDTAMDFINSL